MSKPFRTYDELIEFLIKDKKLNIKDTEYAKAILSKISYYSLVTGYKDTFKDKTTGNYKVDATFEDIYNLYQFDRELRNVFLKAILIAEKSVKTSLAYHFSDCYGESQNAYSGVACYDLNGSVNSKDLNRLLSVFTYNLSGKSDYKYITHYINCHNNVPLWIMVQVMTLGQFAHMFDYLKAKVPIRVCKDYHNITRNQMHSFLSIMTKHRNVCAHGDRFFNYRTKDSVSDTILHDKLKINKVNNRYENGKNDIFSEVIILKYLLDNDDYKDFYKDLNKCISKYKPTEKILEAMGFPKDWKKIIRYKKI